MRRIKKLFLNNISGLLPIILFTMVFVSSLNATISVPTMRGPVNDLAEVLDPDEQSKISSFLNRINDQTGIQIALLTVSSLQSMPIETFSLQVVESWKLGQKGKDNGVLLLISLGDRGIRIEVGYGLEESLTDMKSGQIIRDVITPRFRAGQYQQGIWEGLMEIAEVTAGKDVVLQGSDTPPPVEPDPENFSDEEDNLMGSLILFFFAFIMTRALGRRTRFGKRALSGKHRFFWGLVLGNPGSSTYSSRGSSGSSSYTSSSSRSYGGSSGGHSSGGFSGGGGSFGGGGASGGW